jgi:CTP synthase (UTP-ammonia lyase)
MAAATIALVGEYSASVVAHRAIPRALELARSAHKLLIEWEWVSTATIRDARRDLARFAGLWVVPASPYASMDGALDAIRWARETGAPFLGTCGGFQHALIEYARHVAGLEQADHAETSSSDTLVVAPLSCSLVEKTGRVHFVRGSRLHDLYGTESAHEGYHCNYGVNDRYRGSFEAAGLKFTAHDDAGEIRAFELPPDAHPFFLGTLFQPERAALAGTTPPVVAGFAQAISLAVP